MAQELYLKPAAAFVRGQCQSSSGFDLPTLLKEKPLRTLSREELRQICDLGQRAGLRLHRYKRSTILPRVQRVLGILKGLQPTSLLDIGSGRGAFLWPLLDALREQMGISPEDHQGAVVDRARDMARDYLRQKRDFIWNATNVTFQMRQGLIDFFAPYNTRIRVVYLEVPWQELISRNHHRASPVPVSVIARLAARMDVPTLAEAHRVDWVVPGL